MRVYFDNAATTPISEAVIEAMVTSLKNDYGNPSSIHADGRQVRAVIEKARKTIATHLNASIGEIFFTSGGTESNNMALKCAVRDLGVQRIITSAVEHHCILHTVESLEQHQTVQIDFVEINNKGGINYKSLEKLLQDDSKKTLVSLMHGNNELGTLSDMERISELCQTHNALYHSDTVQTMGHFPLDVDTIKIDFLSGSAHKFHGPKGVGFIYVNGDRLLKPMIDGGSQERNMRAGTENVAGIVGLAKSFDLACIEMPERREHIESIRTYLMEALQANFHDIHFNGDYEGNFLYTVLSVCFPPSPKNEVLMFSLDIHGVSASGGSACSSGVESRSHVLNAIGSPLDRKTIRFSFSHYNTKTDVDFLISKLKMILPVKEATMA